MLHRNLDLMSLCTALKTWLSESADCNHIGLEERRHPLNQGRDDMAKTKGEARTNNKEKTPAKAEGDSWVKVEEEAARACAEQEAQAKAEEEARARAEQEAQVKAEQKARAKAEEEARARAEQEEAQVTAEQEARVRAEQEAQVKAEQEARVRAEQAARAKAEEEVRARVDQEAQVRAVKEDLARAQQAALVDSESEIANFQEIGKEQLNSATTSPTFLATGFQAITAETIEYSKKSLENGSAFVEKLLGAKSFQSAIHVRSEYAKTSYAALVAYLTKIGELNTKLAKEAFKRRSHVA